jgi:hypothetical protein
VTARLLTRIKAIEVRPSVSAASADRLLFVHPNSLHPLHRKRLPASYKFLSLAEEIGSPA